MSVEFGGPSRLARILGYADEEEREAERMAPETLVAADVRSPGWMDQQMYDELSLQQQETERELRRRASSLNLENKDLKKASQHAYENVKSFANYNDKCQEDLAGAEKAGNELLINAMHLKRFYEFELILNTLVHNIDVSSRDVDDEGAYALATALKNNEKFTGSVNMSNNHIGDEGAYAIAQMLATNTTIAGVVDLSRNNIRDNGALELAKALRINKTVSKIYIRNNKISEPTKAKLRAVYNWVI